MNKEGLDAMFMNYGIRKEDMDTLLKIFAKKQR